MSNFGRTLDYVGRACIAFVSIVVNITSTLGYFGSILEYFESTLWYIRSSLRHNGSTLGKFDMCFHIHCV